MTSQQTAILPISKPDYYPAQDIFSPFAEAIRVQKYAHTLPAGIKETWSETAHRVSNSIFDVIPQTTVNLRSLVANSIQHRQFIPGGRYLYAAGKKFHQTQNCLLTRAEDSREGWAQHLHNYAMGLMSGAGMGTVYSDLRGEGCAVGNSGGVSTGPLALMRMSNECGRGIMQGGMRRAAIWAGLHWWHPDVPAFITMKNWPEHIKQSKLQDFSAYAPMDHTNISVILDTEFFAAYTDNNHLKHDLAYSVYWTVVRQMLETGEPGFSVDCGVNEGENNRNACTEVCSSDTDDICNLGSINMARVSSLDEMKRLVDSSIAFLIAGTVYSDLPYPQVGLVRQRNRRLGLGLMGIHEWLLMRGKNYGPDAELESYMQVYADSGLVANSYADKWGLSRPVKTRAIAPTGSIGILAETTTGIEPIFCVAYKRRYLDHSAKWKYQYVVDPTAKKIVEGGVDPASIEDAYRLSEDVERRVKFQAWVQSYVDHGISSTINLPQWGTKYNNEDMVDSFGHMLIKYLPQLRGITVYPDGSRGGQPLTPVSYATAMQHPGEVFMETTDICDITKGGTCSS